MLHSLIRKQTLGMFRVELTGYYKETKTYYIKIDLYDAATEDLVWSGRHSGDFGIINAEDSLLQN